MTSICRFFTCFCHRPPDELKDDRYFLSRSASHRCGIPVSTVDQELSFWDRECYVVSLVLMGRLGRYEHAIVAAIVRMPGGTHGVVTAERARWPGERMDERLSTGDRLVPYSHRLSRSKRQFGQLPKVLRDDPSIPLPSSQIADPAADTPPPYSDIVEPRPEADSPDISATSAAKHIYAFSIDFDNAPPTLVEFAAIAQRISALLPIDGQDTSFLFATAVCMVTKALHHGSAPELNPRLKPLDSATSRSSSGVPFRVFNAGKNGPIRVLDYEDAKVKEIVDGFARKISTAQEESSVVGDRTEQGEHLIEVEVVEDLAWKNPELDEDSSEEEEEEEDSDSEGTEEVHMPHQESIPAVEWARAEARQARTEAHYARIEAQAEVQRAQAEAQQAKLQARAEAEHARAEARQARAEAQRARAEGRQLWANGREAWASGRQTWATGRETWAQGRQTWADGRRVWADGRGMWANAREAWADEREAWAAAEEARRRK
ncbi:hypothetical protein V5O48_016378 [Marasmius crinis-equi]|uniref:Uncharacterized protein n=1 Tax=Marasmius crinis-equi TaxID=585013 RepID=A0ABR3ERW5_9AGAR